MRYSSSANSRAVKLMSVPSAPARRVPGSSSSVPTASTVGPRRRAAPDQRAEPGEQHDERERLRQEVVGAGVERLGLVVLAVLGGEDQDRRPDAFVAQRAAHLVAVHARQEDVEHDGVVGALAAPPEAVVAVVGDVDVEALGGEPVGDRGREQLFVLHDQDRIAELCRLAQDGEASAPQVPHRTPSTRVAW